MKRLLPLEPAVCQFLSQVYCSLNKAVIQKLRGKFAKYSVCGFKTGPQKPMSNAIVVMSFFYKQFTLAPRVHLLLVMPRWAEFVTLKLTNS